MKRTFNWRPRFDEKSRAFPIRMLVGDKPPRSYTWACNTWLNQGSEGACTGFAVSHEAAAKPMPVAGVTAAIAQSLYKRARQLDEWDGEDYEGSSVLGAIKAAKELGWYGEYRWAFGEADLRLAISYKGPAVIGINWYEGMADPDSRGQIHKSGELVGGHAILVNGFNVKTGLYRLHNSWGRGWGRNGECFLSSADMAALLKESGEACVPVVRTKGST